MSSSRVMVTEAEISMGMRALGRHRAPVSGDLSLALFNDGTGQRT